MKKALNILAILAAALAIAAFEAGAQETKTRVDGRVVTTDGKPVAGAVVEIRIAVATGSQGFRALATTGADGTFVADGLAPGTYATSVKLDSYSMVPGTEGNRFTVAEGEAHHELTVKMSRLGMVSGEVIDGSGSPAKAVRVFLLSYRFNNRSRELDTSVHAEAKDGQFQIKNVPPGRYYLMALKLTRTEANALLPTFYPSSPDVHEAQLVNVGQEPVEGLELRMLQGPTYTVQVTVQGVPPALLVPYPSDEDPIGFQVYLVAREESLRTVNFNGSGSRNGAVRRFDGIPAGDYIVWVRYSPKGGNTHVSQMNIHVDGGQNDFEMRYDEGVEVTGRVRRADGLPLDAPVPGAPRRADPTGHYFQLAPVDTLGSRPPMRSMGPMPAGFTVEADGTFHGKVAPGRYIVRVNGLMNGPPTRLASVRLGGVDMTGKALDIQLGSELEVEVSMEFAQVTVAWPTLPEGSKYTMAMWPAVQDDYARTVGITPPRPGEAARPAILEPGEFFVAVFENVSGEDQGMWQSLDVMSRFNAQATRVKLGVGPQTVAPKVIPPAAAQKIFDEFR